MFSNKLTTYTDLMDKGRFAWCGYMIHNSTKSWGKGKVDKFVKFSYFSLCLQEHVFNPLMESSYFLVLSEIAAD